MLDMVLLNVDKILNISISVRYDFNLEDSNF